MLRELARHPVLVCLLLLCGCAAGSESPGTPSSRPPNLVLILADDLGWGDLGSYGQERIRTPELDRIAREGMRFTQFYAGSAVCAPSRCVLLTGRDAGRAQIRDNSPWARRENPFGEGQEPLAAGTDTLARRLQARGYATLCVGKWGLGGPGTEGAPLRQGFDHFFGYLCQAEAHNHTPDHLWKDGERFLTGNAPFDAHQELAREPESYAQYAGDAYAPDLFREAALEFVRANRDTPFFLFYATTVPHVALQVPEDSLAAYPATWDAAPYLGERGYLPHPRPRAAYAAMVSRLDADVGALDALLTRLEIADETVLLFTSDNGPATNGGADPRFFESAGPWRGAKGSLHEGGIRVPLLVRWPGHVAAGNTSALAAGFQDVLPTLLELGGADAPQGIDGISLAPTLLGRASEQRTHARLYWELGRGQALRAGDWKLIRRWSRDRDAPPTLELFDLARDPGERTDRAAEEPGRVTRLLGELRRARVPAARFPAPYDG